MLFFSSKCSFLTFKTKDRLLEKIKGCSPPDPCQYINLMVIGQIGTGKSSFIHTLCTALSDNDQQSKSTIATPTGISTGSSTKSVGVSKLIHA